MTGSRAGSTEASETHAPGLGREDRARAVRRGSPDPAEPRGLSPRPSVRRGSPDPAGRPDKPGGSWPRRRAVTLIEVLLVLALMAMIAAMAWPSLNRSLQTERLRRAADVVRAAWGKARVRALSTGYTHIFQYTVRGSRYATQRRTSAEVTVDGPPAGAPTGFADASYENPTPFGEEHTLPKGVTFLGSETAADTRAAMLVDDAGQFRSVDQGWSQPIFFYPDGTTSTARLVLKDQRGHTIELMLRGLTGVVTVGDVQSPAEGDVLGLGDGGAQTLGGSDAQTSREGMP